jgi:hypothetical protein
LTSCSVKWEVSLVLMAVLAQQHTIAAAVLLQQTCTVLLLVTAAHALLLTSRSPLTLMTTYSRRRYTFYIGTVPACLYAR